MRVLFIVLSFIVVLVLLIITRFIINLKRKVHYKYILKKDNYESSVFNKSQAAPYDSLWLFLEVDFKKFTEEELKNDELRESLQKIKKFEKIGVKLFVIVIILVIIAQFKFFR